VDGDHARANATFLTGAQAKKTGGKDIHLGRSFDQVAADHLSAGSRFRSLELSASKKRTSGVCDSGYSCAYAYNISWQDERTPLPPQVNPSQIFKQLFGARDPHELAFMEHRMKQQQSVLDSLRGDTARLNRKISSEDREQLEAYYTSLRTVEKRLQTKVFNPNEVPEDFKLPDGIPASYSEYLDTMYDLMLLAFQTDSTRVITFLQANDGSGRSFPELNISAGHHQLSHHKGDQAKVEQPQGDRRVLFTSLRTLPRKAHKYPRWLWAKSRRQLHDCLRCAISDGNRHKHNNLPVILAGGAVEGNRHIKYNDEPMCNLYCTMLDKAGVHVPRFGDSSGLLKGV